MHILSRLLLTLATALPLACAGDDGVAATDATTTGASASSTSAGSSASSSSGSSGSSAASSSATETSGASSSTGPDPDYVRACQAGDFTCDDWGCANPPNVAEGQCYKRCTPTEVGGLDDECDEPERPFCSQVGHSQGGDFDCNACFHICVAAPIDQCQAGADACG